MIQVLKKIIPGPIRRYAARIYHSLVKTPPPVETVSVEIPVETVPVEIPVETVPVESAPAGTSLYETDQARLVDLSALKKTADLWLVIDHPQQQEVDIQGGVLSIRGWAWSEQHGRGKLWLTVQAKGQPERIVPVKHRLWRPDITTVISVIPSDNFAGFEVSIDRFDLAVSSKVVLHYAATNGNSAEHYQSEPFTVTVHHAHKIDGFEYPPCNGCGTNEGFTDVGRKDNLPLVQCPNCGLVFTRPRPHLDVIFDRYSQEYFQNEYLKDIHEKLTWLRPHWDIIFLHMKRFQMVSPELFEVGTGAGYLLDHARTHGWQTSGIDLNETAVEYARDTLNLDVRQGDITRMELPKGKFGAIILDSTMEHFTDPAGVIQKCAEALAPGGGLFIWTLGNEGNLFATLGMDLNYVGPSEHLYYFPTSVLCAMCERAGLRVDDIFREAIYYDSVAVVATKRGELFET